MTVAPERPEFTFSRRTSPLTAQEMEAALRAIHRALVAARCLTYEGADPSVYEHIFDGLHNLPTCLLRPAEFEDIFRSDLERLVRYLPSVRGVIDEFDEALRR